MFLILLLFIVGVFGNPKYTSYQVQEDFVPILGYHRIGESISSTIITPERFQSHVKYLTEDFGCSWITMNELSYYMSNGQKLPTNACIMNFDDGAASQLFSMCSLNEYKIPATFYIASSNLGNSSEYRDNSDWIVRDLTLNGIDKHDYYMYPQEVEMIHSWGHDIQAHTLTHANLPSLSYDEQVLEIVGSMEELEAKGYSISSFAYPYGNYNSDTEDILSEQITLGNLVIARSTEKLNTWRDQRSAVFNISNTLHYNYIKPEFYTAEELVEKIKYTNWWQFEENYYVYGDATTSVSSNVFLVPQIENSYAILALYGIGSEIETTFATKYTSGITVDILSYHDGSGAGYTVQVDGIAYYPVKHEPNSELYMEIIEGGGQFDYYNYYFNIDVLKSGLHKMKITKTTSGKIYLDKFRVFSEKDQTFTKSSSYFYDCIEGDHNCDCDYSEKSGGTNTTSGRIEITQMQAITMIILFVVLFSCCLCMNTGSNREFRQYGHIKTQRDNYLQN